MFGESDGNKHDSINEEEGDEDVSKDEDSKDTPLDPDNARTRGLRQMTRIEYSAAALPTDISIDDQQKILISKRYYEQTHWLQSINENFKNLTVLKTWENVNHVPHGIKVIPWGIIFRLKRNSDGLPSSFKEILVARSNFKYESFEYGKRYATVAV